MKKLLILIGSFFLCTQITFASAPLTPTRFIDFNGLQIAAYESKGSQGPGVLMIHGNTSSANSYNRVLSTFFARRNRVVAIDLPGFGRSDRAPSYNTALFADAIAAAANALGTEEGILVGWSLGGNLAFQAASRLPNLKGIFTFGTAPVGVDPSLPAPFLTPDESPAGVAVNFGFVSYLTDEQITEYVTAFFRPNFPVKQFFINDGIATDPLTRAAVLAAATGQDPTFLDELVITRNLTIPLALVLGLDDAFVRLEFLEALAPSLPTLVRESPIVLPRTGHAIHWERPFFFTAILRAFIARVLDGDDDDNDDGDDDDNIK